MDQKIEEDLALRRQQTREYGLAAFDALDIVGYQVLKKRRSVGTSYFHKAPIWQQRDWAVGHGRSLYICDPT